MFTRIVNRYENKDFTSKYLSTKFTMTILEFRYNSGILKAINILQRQVVREEKFQLRILKL